MKICLVITEFWPLVGGLQHLALRLGQELARAGHEVVITTRFTQNRRSFLGYFLESEERCSTVTRDLQCEILSVPARWRLLMRAVPKLMGHSFSFGVARRIFSKAFDRQFRSIVDDCTLVHYFGVGVEMLGFAALHAARNGKIPFVVEPALHAGQWGEASVDQTLYRECDRVLTHTRFELERLSKLGISSSKADVVYNGVDCVVSGNAVRFREQTGIAGPIILFLGRKTVEKGYHLVREAFAAVQRSHPNANLVLIGPNDSTKPITASPSVVDLGKVDEQTKQDALSACDLLCVPSEGESFGMVYFEAWHYRKPVIGLDIPTLHETIAQCGGGLLAQPTISDLATQLSSLLSNPVQRAQMGEAGARFAARFTWDLILPNYIRSYERAISVAGG